MERVDVSIYQLKLLSTHPESESILKHHNEVERVLTEVRDILEQSNLTFEITELPLWSV